MYSSYNDASQISAMWVLYGGGTIYNSQQTNQSILNQIGEIEKLCSAVITSLIEDNDTSLHVTVNDYILSAAPFSLSNIIKYALFILNKIIEIKPDYGTEQYTICINYIIEFISKSDNTYSQNDIAQLYIKIIQTVLGKPFESPEKPVTQKLVESAKEFIYNHFSEPITLSQIADSLSVSPNYLSKIFHEAVGESYIKFITRIRMEYAAYLLKTNSDEHIFNIAEKTGYYNLKHFNFVFKEFYNMTPTEYQNSQQI